MSATIGCEFAYELTDCSMHILAPATTKFRVPRLVFVPVTARQPDTADRGCRPPATDVTSTQSTAILPGTFVTVA